MSAVNRMRMLLFLLPLVALTAAPPTLVAQQAERLAVSDTIWEIRLTGGESYVGQVVSLEGGEVALRTATGARVQFARSAILSVRIAEGRVTGGQYWSRDPNATRLFFGPTGRSLRAGEGYVGAFELFFPFVSIGVTDWLTFAGGTPILPEVMGQAVYIAPKARLINTESVDVGAGVLALFSTGNDFESAGVLYGVGTWGTPDNAVTAGIGFGFAGDEMQNRPALLLGGERRLSARIKAVSENYLITFTDDRYGPTGQVSRETNAIGLLSGGIRFFGERLSADLGLGLGIADNDLVCCLPLVNFVYSFGGGR